MSEDDIKIISSINFVEIDTRLLQTEFIKEYSKLPFNGGFIFRTVQPESNGEEFFKVVSDLSDKPIRKASQAPSYELNDEVANSISFTT